MMRGLTLRFCPDFFKFAQSRGPWPGASATFPRLAGWGGGLVVVVGTSKDEDDVAVETPEVPGRLLARGGGGGGMRCVSVNIRGTDSGCEPEAALCALFTAGNAGGAAGASA